MNANVVPQMQLQQRTGIDDETLIGNIVDVLYDKLLDDCRVNGFFSDRPVTEQTEPLKAYLKAVLGGPDNADSELMELLDDYFMAGFARTDTPHSLVTGNDFAFLLDIIGGQEIPPITLLCDGHSHLIKLGPDDFHYDVAMGHLADSLKELELADDVTGQIMAIAESARDGLLGRGAEARKAA